MSQTYDLLGYLRWFFEILCSTHGWLKPEFADVSSVNGGLRISTRRDFWVSEGQKTQVHLAFDLVPAERGRVLLLSSMIVWLKGVSQAGILLSPIDFLACHGKEFYLIGEKMTGDYWRISCAKDLDSLIREYDKMAFRLDRSTLFQ